jgi:hypothetical protein
MKKSPAGDSDRKAKVTDEHRQEAKRLRVLWDEKADRPTQQIFGETNEIGNQSAVGQFLRGDVPLSMNAARGFAKGLGCKIADFSPRLAKEASAARGHPAAKTGLSLVDLNRQEGDLILLFRELAPEQRAKLLQHAQAMYAKKHPAEARQVERQH